MVDTFPASQSIETRADLGTGDEAIWAYWQTQEQVVERDEKKWMKRGREIVKRYRDERPEATAGTHRFNILWSNVQTLIPVLYGRTPAADVARRFKNQNDDTGRLAAELLESCLNFSVESQDFDDVMEAIVEDRLLPGRGVMRVLYEPTYGDKLPDGDNEEFEETEAAPDIVDDIGDEDQKSAEPLREVINEEVIVSYVFWEDYREGPARSWQEVPWVRFRAYMNRDELIERFGKKGKEVNLDYSPKGTVESAREEPPADVYKKAVVHEYWDKVKKEVVWLAPGTPDIILDKQDDPLGLPDFFPSINPLRATATNDKRIPVADYIEYQDQARELDTLTARIDVLTRALKVSGIYPGEEKQVLQQLIDEGAENRLIPVQDWARFSEKGSLDTFIQWMPIKQIAETLVQLYDARDRVKQILYEITGIGDIMRGQTSPDETLGAQELKANFSTRRITPQQRKVAKAARDVFRLMGQIIAIHFASETISKMTGYPQLQPVPKVSAPPPQFIPAPPQQQPAQPPQMGGNVVPLHPGMMPNPGFAQWQQMQQQAQAVSQQNKVLQKQFDDAIALLREDVHHGFRIDIEADSTIAPDEQAEKKARTEFISEAVPLLGQIIPMAQGNPALAEAAKQLFLFGLRGFKVARPLEETFEKAFDAVAKMPQAPPKGGVDSPQDLALRAQQLKQDGADTAAKNQAAMQENAIKAQQVSGQLQIDQQRLEMEAAHNTAKLAIEAQNAKDEADFRRIRGTAVEGRLAGGLS